MLAVYLFCIVMMLLAAGEFYLAEKQARSKKRACGILVIGIWILLVAIFSEGNSTVRDLVGLLACMNAMLLGAFINSPKYQRK